MSDAPDGDLDIDPPMRRPVAVVLVALVALLPLAAVAAVVYSLTRSDSDGLPALDVGSCVFVSEVDNSITDLACPDGNGVVIALSDSTTACPASARWANLRDGNFYCVERRLVSEPTSD